MFNFISGCFKKFAFMKISFWNSHYCIIRYIIQKLCINKMKVYFIIHIESLNPAFGIPDRM